MGFAVVVGVEVVVRDGFVGVEEVELFLGLCNQKMVEVGVLVKVRMKVLVKFVKLAVGLLVLLCLHERNIVIPLVFEGNIGG